MFKNYLTITLRRIARQKLYAGINIFGLAIGIAFCVLIFLYVGDELNFDRFHEKTDNIYRVTTQSFASDGGVENVRGLSAHRSNHRVSDSRYTSSRVFTSTQSIRDHISAQLCDVPSGSGGWPTLG